MRGFYHDIAAPKIVARPKHIRMVMRRLAIHEFDFLKIY